MPYRIDYSADAASPEKAAFMPRILMTCMFFSVFLVLVSLFWPEGREVLQLLLIPGESNVTMAAAETFASELYCGNSLKGAAVDFIRSLAGAY